MPNRAGKRFYDQHYRWLARTDGHYCLICRGHGELRAPPEYPLEVDHARTDLDPKDEAYWEPEDTCLLCQSCNLSLRRKPVEEHRFIIRHYRALNVCEREKEKASGHENIGPPVEARTIMHVVNFMHGSAEMQAKSHYEPKFAVFVWERISENGNFLEKELLDSFAYRSRASQVTLKRYLDSYCSIDGPCRRSKDADGNVIITFKFPMPKKKKKRSVQYHDRG